jgi:hypothetical protein
MITQALRWRPTVRQMMGGVAVFGLAIGFVLLVFLDDSPDQLILSFILGKSTVRSKGYSEQKFRTIRIGMTASQVEAI